MPVSAEGYSIHAYCENSNDHLAWLTSNKQRGKPGWTGEGQFSGPNKGQTKINIREQGWKLTGKGKYYCPSCAKGDE